jgi:hypothetical protein
MKLPEYQNSSAGGVAKPFNGAILLESVRVAFQKLRTEIESGVRS